MTAAPGSRAAAVGDGELLTERRGAVLLITLNRPHVLNAMTPAFDAAMLAAGRELDEDDALRVGVVTGAGDSFCVGMDLTAFADGEFGDEVAADGRFLSLERPPAKPLIAAVEGHAAGGGWELALACDMVVAARDARFALPEVRWGFVALGGGLVRLPRRIPHAVAMELALTGDAIDGERAARLGAVNHVTEPGGALERALALAERIARNAPLATRATTELVRRARDWSEQESWERQLPIGGPPCDSVDAREGARAFAAGRRPVWRGR